MSGIKRWLASHFQNLYSDEYQITSPETSDYNCFAWAAGEDDRWWAPAEPGYWPDGVPRELTLEAFIQNNLKSNKYAIYRQGRNRSRRG